jgi:hypothetical protein
MSDKPKPWEWPEATWRKIVGRAARTRASP